MNKKDRIAIVVTILYMFWPLIVVVDSGNTLAALIFTIPVISYWGYRFVKNDISFFKNNSED
ncbi:MAG: hypothetical protein GYB32_14970 [Algicola sp.]|uniref:hypothetical protein n=1 Tax=Vibrio diabolicus TaxID=50719 RepID=UPI001EC356D5|nr:hypothetical protein [Algicola sp.]HCG6670456.1 hypothetical protein [Vibrio parahaemolyticus]HCG6702054.1 hypothetical protein [Vibrio parahaemolyticus]HCG6712568.1 hypothetical protein [Vibrio parahaemolyticus]